MIVLFQIDLIRPLEEQGPFDLILHKLTDVVAKADLGHGAAQIQIERLQVRQPALMLLSLVRRKKKLASID